MSVATLDRTKKFISSNNAKTLALASIHGNIKIHTWPQDYIEVIFNCNPKALESCTATEKDDRFLVWASQGINIELEVEIFVPENTNLINNSNTPFEGTLIADNHLGNVILYTTKNSFIHIRSANKVQASVSGFSQCRLGRIDEELITTAKNFGIVTVDQGEISYINVRTTDSAVFESNGGAHTAVLHATGSSRISIDHVIVTKSKHVEDPAKIIILKK